MVTWPFLKIERVSIWYQIGNIFFRGMGISIFFSKLKKNLGPHSQNTPFQYPKKTMSVPRYKSRAFWIFLSVVDRKLLNGKEKLSPMGHWLGGFGILVPTFATSMVVALVSAMSDRLDCYATWTLIHCTIPHGLKHQEQIFPGMALSPVTELTPSCYWRRSQILIDHSDNKEFSDPSLSH